MDEARGAVQSSENGQTWRELKLHCHAAKESGHRSCTVELEAGTRQVRLSAPASGVWGVSDVAVRFVGHLD